MADDYKVSVSSGSTVISGADAMNNVTLIKNVANYGDTMNVVSGGKAYDTVISSGGVLFVSNGGYVSGVVINGTGKGYIYSGASAAHVVHQGTDYLRLFSNAVVDDLEHNGTNLWISSATVTNFRVGGKYTEFMDGSVSGGALTGGTVMAVYGGSITDFSVTGGHLRADGDSNRVQLSDFTQNGGKITLNNAVLTNATLTGGNLYVASNSSRGGAGELNNALISGATVSQTYGVVSGATLESGNFWIGGGVASGTVVNGGSFTVTTGTGTVGEAVNTTVTGGTLYFRGGRSEDLTISGGTVHVSGGVMSGTTVYGGTLNASGGSFDDVNVASGGVANIEVGGTVSTLNVGTKGKATVNGTVTTMTVGNATNVTLQADAQVGTLQHSGSLNVNLGGTIENYEHTGTYANTATGTVINGGFLRGTLLAAYGGDISDFTVSAGHLRADGDYERVQITNLTQKGGSVTLNNAVLTNATLTGGNLYVASNSSKDGAGELNNALISGATVSQTYGVVSGATLESGNFWIGGGVASGTVVNGGSFTVTTGTGTVGEAVNTTINGGTVTTASKLTNTTVNGGTINAWGNSYFDGITIDGGTLTLKAASITVKDLDLVSGNFILYGGQTVDGVTIKQGGSLRLTAANANVRGIITCKGSNTLHVSQSPILMADDAWIVYDVSGITLDVSSVIASGETSYLRLESNTDQALQNYKIIVADDQATGTIRLDSNHLRTQDLVITNADGTWTDALKADGSNSVSYNGRTYSLRKVAGDQYWTYLTVAGPVALWQNFTGRSGNSMVIPVSDGAGLETVTLGTAETYISMTVSSGGSFNEVNVTSGGSAIIGISGTVAELNVTSGGSAIIGISGTVAELNVGTQGNATINGAVTSMTVGNATYVTLQADAQVGTLQHSGSLNVNLGGTIENYEHTGTYANTATGTVINGGFLRGTLLAAYGGDISDFTVSAGHLRADGDYERVQITNLTQKGGSVTLNNAVLTNATLTGGNLYVASNSSRGGAGELNNALISGATVSQTYGVVSGATLESGNFWIGGGVASGTVVNDGSFTVTTGTGTVGEAVNTTINGGTVTTASKLTNTTVNGGTINAWENSYFDGITIDGGTLNLKDVGITVKDWTLGGGVTASVYNSITLDGTINIAGQVYFSSSAKTATVTADTATVIFDTVNYQSGINGMFYYLEKLEDAGELRIAVSDASEVGSTYELTDKATLTNFDKAFKVYNGEDYLGDVTLNNATATGLISGTKSYGLNPYYVENRGYKVQFTVDSGMVDATHTVTDESVTFTWDAVKNAAGYKVSTDGGTTWTDNADTTSYTHVGSGSVSFMAKAYSDATHLGDASQEIMIAGTADCTAAADAVSSAGENATIVLRDGTYTSGGVVTMKAGQTLEGQGTQDTIVSKAIYGAGNAVTIKDLKASTNVAGGAVNAAVTSGTDLTVASALLTDAFAGSLVKTGTVEVASAGADLTGTTFRNLYGAGYATGSGVVLNNTTVDLTVSGGCSRTEAGYGSIYGAGRAAGGATLNAGTVNVTVNNSNATKLGALYAGGYSNNGTVSATATNVTVTSGDFAKFVAAGAQVYSSSAASTIGNTNLTITGGTFDNAVLGASYAAGGASASVTSATTEISGGTFHGYVAGGGYVNASTLTVGAVDLTITGGTFTKYIFGGNLSGSSAAAGTVTNAVNLTLDATSSDINVIGPIYAGSMNSGTVGSTVVELKGIGSNLSFSKLYGCGSYSGTQTGGVTGTKALKFTGFSGNLSGKLYDFDTFTMSGSTVSFTQAQTLSGISTWDLTLTNTVTDENALINWEAGGTNSFASDTMKLTFNAASEDDLLVVLGDTKTKTVEEQKVFDLDLSTSGLASVTLNGATAAKQGDGSWMATIGDVNWYLKNVAVIDEENGSTNNLVLTTKIA